MTTTTAPGERTTVPDHELDVRPLPEADKDPAVVRAYNALTSGDSVVLITDRDPAALRGIFDIEHPGGYRWERLDTGQDHWRVRIGKLAATPLPHVVGDTATGQDRDTTGPVWKLPMRQRDLDSNIIRLTAGAAIDGHYGPDLDVLLVVLDGTGELTTERDPVPLRAGALVWLPRGSWRGFSAGSAGLRYLTVHQRRQALKLTPPSGA